MADVSIIVKGKTASETTSTTSINYVNPEATKSQLYELGYTIFQLTDLSEPIIIKQTQEILTDDEE